VCVSVKFGWQLIINNVSVKKFVCFCHIKLGGHSNTHTLKHTRTHRTTVAGERQRTGIKFPFGDHTSFQERISPCWGFVVLGRKKLSLEAANNKAAKFNSFRGQDLSLRATSRPWSLASIMTLATAVVVVSLVSVAGNAFVLFSGLMFATMRKRFFVRLIMMLSFTDLMVSIAGSFGFPPSGTYLCAVQAALEMYFLRANWLWTTVLVFQMYQFIAHNKFYLSELTMHTFVWSFSAILSFLPLLFARFGRDGANSNSEMCFVMSPNSVWFLTWLIIDWIGVILACIGLMLYYIRQIINAYKDVTDIIVRSNVNALVNCLYLYPLILAVTWGSNAVINLIIMLMRGYWSETSHDNYALAVTAIASLSNGFLVSVVFFWKSPEARHRWKLLFWGRTTIQEEVPHEYDEETSSEMSLFSEVFLSESGMRSSMQITA
jgi:hypothetical protein